MLELIDVAVKGHDTQLERASELLHGYLGEHLEQKEVVGGTGKATKAHKCEGKDASDLEQSAQHCGADLALVGEMLRGVLQCHRHWADWRRFGFRRGHCDSTLESVVAQLRSCERVGGTSHHW